MDTNQLAAPYGWELATDANGNQRLVPAYDSPFVGAYGALIDAPAGRIGPGFEPAASYGSFISPAALAALAKARAATGLPAGMAEHAGAAGIPANVNPSKAALVDQVAREAVADESATRDATSGTNYLRRAWTPLAINAQSVTATPVTATPVDRALTVAGQASPVDRALTVAGQASPQFSQIPGGPLAKFAQPHSGAQYQPMSASSRSWTNMPQPSNPMPWGDSAPAGHLDTAPTGSISTAPARATAPAAAAPTAPAQSSPGFFSGLFKDPYAGMSPKQMNEKAQDMQRAGDEYGANLLTQRADNAITSSDGSFAQGGSVDENHPVVQRAMHLVRSFLLNG